MGVETALIMSTLIGTATSIHAQQKQQSAMEAAAEAEEEARLKAEEEAKRIAKEAGPEGESATIGFGTEKRKPSTGYEGFLVPRTGTTSGLATGATTGGLGFS